MTRAAWCAAALVAISAGCHESIYFDRADGAAAEDASPDAGADAGNPSGPCDGDDDCALDTLHCDPVRGRCVPCLEDMHCADPELPRCDVGLGRCVQCGRPDDCASGHTCETRTRRCVSTCASRFECTIGHAECDSDRGTCEECEEPEHCFGMTGAPHCRRLDHLCVACTSDTHCADPTPRCDAITARCVACTDDAHCPSDRPVCDPVALSCAAPAR